MDTVPGEVSGRSEPSTNLGHWTLWGGAGCCRRDLCAEWWVNLSYRPSGARGFWLLFGTDPQPSENHAHHGSWGQGPAGGGTPPGKRAVHPGLDRDVGGSQ